MLHICPVIGKNREGQKRENYLKNEKCLKLYFLGQKGNCNSEKMIYSPILMACFILVAVLYT